MSKKNFFKNQPSFSNCFQSDSVDIFLNESSDDDTNHQAKDWVGQVGVVQEAGGEVGAEQLEGRLEDGERTQEEVKAADNINDQAQHCEFCVHLSRLL